MQERTEHVGRPTSITIGSEAGDMSLDDAKLSVAASMREIATRYGTHRLADLEPVAAGDGLLVHRPTWLDDDHLWSEYAEALRPWWHAIVRAEVAR